MVWDKKNFLLFGLTKVQPFQVTGRAQKIIIIGNVFYGWILEDFLVKVIARFPNSASEEGFQQTLQSIARYE